MKTEAFELALKELVSDINEVYGPAEETPAVEQLKTDVFCVYDLVRMDKAMLRGFFDQLKNVPKMFEPPICRASLISGKEIPCNDDGNLFQIQYELWGQKSTGFTMENGVAKPVV